jgi:CRP/FNR family transcriptional regulator, cyclic AMP receptor protein
MTRPGGCLSEMANMPTVRLLEADPDIGQFLAPDERAQAKQLLVPVHSFPKGELGLEAVLDRSGAFGALVLDGLVLAQLRVSDHLTARLLGPGDLLSVRGPQSMLIANARNRATVETHVALLGARVRAAAQRWPQLAAGLFVRMGEQCERVTTQLAICQLPRVEERLLGILWLLAESWGQVTSAGTTLPLTLTHDVLGALIGARRPTVTLALGELSQRGAIVQQDAGWLLLAKPPTPTGPPAEMLEPALIERRPSPWARGLEQSSDRASEWRELRETVRQLREQHVWQKERMREQVRALRSSRLRNTASRERFARESVRPRQVPSGE